MDEGEYSPRHRGQGSIHLIRVYVKRGEERTPSFKQVALSRLRPTLPSVLARRFDKQDN